MEVPLIHEKVSKEEARDRAIDMVKAVRLPDPERIMRRLSAPAFGRPAAARRDRDGAAVKPAAPDPRRADNRARRHGRSGHRRTGQGPDRPHRRVLAVHLAQSRPHSRDLRRGDGDVFGRGGRDGPGARRVSARCATPIRRACSARCRCPARTRTTIRSFPSPASCRCRTSGREAAISGRAARISSQGLCDAAAVPMRAVAGGDDIEAVASGSRRSTGPHRRGHATRLEPIADRPDDARTSSG